MASGKGSSRFLRWAFTLQERSRCGVARFLLSASCLLALTACASIEFVNRKSGVPTTVRHSSVGGDTLQVGSIILEQKDAAVDLKGLCKDGEVWKTVEVDSSFLRGLFKSDANEVRYTCQKSQGRPIAQRPLETDL